MEEVCVVSTYSEKGAFETYSTGRTAANINYYALWAFEEWSGSEKIIYLANVVL